MNSVNWFKVGSNGENILTDLGRLDLRYRLGYEL